jgi:hypothetical protein
MRSSWGTTNDPMTVGSVPNFFINLYGVPTSQTQFKPWLKNLGDSANPPHMGKNVPCPPGNIFNSMIPEAMSSVLTGTQVDLNNTYFNTLISLGDKIIDYVENTKTGDAKGWDLSKNPGLFFDLYWIIWQNINILTPIQQNFVNSDSGNPFKPHPPTANSQMEFFDGRQKYEELLHKHIMNNSEKINIQQVIKSIENGGY